jgi:hypothetical protein
MRTVSGWWWLATLFVGDISTTCCDLMQMNCLQIAEATIDGNKMMLLMVDKMPESIDDDDD